MRRAVLVAMAAAVLTAPVGAVSASGSSAVSAALMLEKGVDRDLYAVGLTREERTAVLGVLDDPPDGLAELRGKLTREHRGQPPW